MGRHVVRVASSSPGCWPASSATSPGPRCRPPDDLATPGRPARPGRRAGPARRPLRPRGGRRRRAPPAHERAARLGQDDARPTPARPAARRSTTTRPSRPPGSTRRPACRCRPAASCGGHRSGRRTTARRPVAMVGGGGARMQPGEISIATNGVLFLDELAEFHADVLDSLRQPLEEGVVRVARASHRGHVPGPVPAGGGHEPVPVRRRRLARRVPVQRPRPGSLRAGGSRGRCSTASTSGSPVIRPDPRTWSAARRANRRVSVAARVLAARDARRGAGRAGQRRAAAAPSSTGMRPARPRRRPTASRTLLRQGRLSARGLQRLRRVALTLADLAGRRRPAAHRRTSRRPCGCAPIPSASSARWAARR